MEIGEALSNLDQVCAEFKGTRADHVVLQQSMQVVHKECSRIDLPDLSEPEPEPDKESDGNKK